MIHGGLSEGLVNGSLVSQMQQFALTTVPGMDLLKGYQKMVPPIDFAWLKIVVNMD